MLINHVAVQIIAHAQPCLYWLATHVASDKEGSRQPATLRNLEEAERERERERERGGREGEKEREREVHV